jgi:hypothetical protein
MIYDSGSIVGLLAFIDIYITNQKSFIIIRKSLFYQNENMEGELLPKIVFCSDIHHFIRIDPQVNPEPKATRTI